MTNGQITIERQGGQKEGTDVLIDMDEIVVHLAENVAEDPAIGENGDDEKGNAQKKEEISDGDVQEITVRHRSQA